MVCVSFILMQLMKNNLKKNLFIEFDANQIDTIISHFDRIKVMKNTLLLNEGEVCRDFLYVETGCIRTFYIDLQGNQKTSSVLIPTNFGTAWTSFISQQPSVEFIEAIEDSVVRVINYSRFFDLVKSDILWKDFYLKSIELAYLNQSRKIEALMTLNSKQRYQKLLKGNPTLIQKLSNRILASFLHMREETLSRIKSQR